MIPEGSIDNEEMIRLWDLHDCNSYGFKEYYVKDTWKTRTNKQNYFHRRCSYSGTENHQKLHYRDHGFRARSYETAYFNIPSQEFEASMGSEVHDVGHEMETIGSPVVGQILGSVSEMSVTNVYNVNKLS